MFTTVPILVLLLMRAKQKPQLRLMGLTLLQVFGHEAKYRTYEEFDLMTALDQALDPTVPMMQCHSVS